jgi:hypothetical protein
MFARGNWAILGLKLDSLKTFQDSLLDKTKLLYASQLVASSVTRIAGQPSVGINPFEFPRKDENLKEVDAEERELSYQILAHFASQDEENRGTVLGTTETLIHNTGGIPRSLRVGYFAGLDAVQYQLRDGIPYYGFWFVENTPKDITHTASKREHFSYKVTGKPYKFLQGGEKKDVDALVTSDEKMERKQFPVLLDFIEGRLYIEATSKNTISSLVYLLDGLGIQVEGLAWSFGEPTWPAAFLNKLYEQTHFAEAFNKRAEERTRFTPDQIEPLEDKVMERIVTKFFGLAQLENELWFGLGAPAQVQLTKSMDPITVATVENATTLLKRDEAKLWSGSVDVQEVDTYTTKSGVEKTNRKTIFTLDINDTINFTEVGAAMLRGFDLPQFKRDLTRQMRKAKTVPPVADFWFGWLQGMRTAVSEFTDSVSLALGIEGTDIGLVVLKTFTPEAADTSSDGEVELNF